MQNIQERFKLHGVKLPEDTVKKYTVLTMNDIMEKEIGKLVKHCKQIFDDDEVSNENCQMMLYDFNWRCDELLEKFSESESMNDFLEKNKIDLTIPLSAKDMVASFVQSTSLLKWCPNKFEECKNIIKIVSSDIEEEIVCGCGFVFCYKCDKIPHSSFPCILLNEWMKQCEEYDFIFKHNNVICPYCYQFYEVDACYLSITDITDYALTCTHCEGVFVSYENLLTKPGIFPDYEHSLEISILFERYTAQKNVFGDTEDFAFLSTACQVLQYILLKIHPIPIFSFYLDKKYLSQNSSASSEIVSTFELFNVELERMLADLMNSLDHLCENNNYVNGSAFVFKEEEDKIMGSLHHVQTYLDKFVKFINETHGWIFKLPEIQDVYNTAYNDKIENFGDDDDEETADVDMNVDESDINEMEDDNGEGSSSSEVEEEYVDDGEGNEFVMA